jgi:hypothetical protein
LELLNQPWYYLTLFTPLFKRGAVADEFFGLLNPAFGDDITLQTDALLWLATDVLPAMCLFLKFKISSRHLLPAALYGLE